MDKALNILYKDNKKNVSVAIEELILHLCSNNNKSTNSVEYTPISNLNKRDSSQLGDLAFFPVEEQNSINIDFDCPVYLYETTHRIPTYFPLFKISETHPFSLTLFDSLCKLAFNQTYKMLTFLVEDIGQVNEIKEVLNQAMDLPSYQYFKSQFIFKKDVVQMKSFNPGTVISFLSDESLTQVTHTLPIELISKQLFLSKDTLLMSTLDNCEVRLFMNEVKTLSFMLNLGGLQYLHNELELAIKKIAPITNDYADRYWFNEMLCISMEDKAYDPDVQHKANNKYGIII